MLLHFLGMATCDGKNQKEDSNTNLVIGQSVQVDAKFLNSQHEFFPATTKGNSSKGVQIPQLIWLQHANAHQNFSSQAKFLSSNFLFSVPTKKPQDGSGNGRFVVRQGQNIPSSQGGQVDKA
ncbi:hypothetical protein KIW84_034593 [Lathyrus oleraceus]|uniref:Uncharacterized protein n=1 Tax=Pisum sativum TaxID=3888 RepID=A0A9D5B5E8_PEA|nr:hypothetical protein KIW84_034593 [Pisum sativum]